MTLKEEKEGKETNEGALEEECWKFKVTGVEDAISASSYFLCA